MNFLRTVALWFLRLLCVLSVSALVSLVTLSMTLLDRNDVKQWLSASGAYDSSLIETLFTAESVEANLSQPLPADQTLLSNEVVKNAMMRTFTSDFIQSGFETVIDASYDWIEGKRASFSFSIPLETKRDTFIAELTKEVEPRVAALPPCGSTVQSLCRPSTMTPAEFTQQIIVGSIDQANILKAPLTEQMFATASKNQDSTILTELPRLRSAVTLLLFILPALFCISALGAALLTLRGVRLQFFIKLSRGIFFNMILVVIMAGAFIALAHSQALPIQQLIGEANPLAPVLERFVTQMLGGFGWALLLVAGVTLLLSTASWIGLSVIKNRHPTQVQPVNFTDVPQPLPDMEPPKK